jgi:hypothetical protein
MLDDGYRSINRGVMRLVLGEGECFRVLGNPVDLEASVVDHFSNVGVQFVRGQFQVGVSAGCAVGVVRGYGRSD